MKKKAALVLVDLQNDFCAGGPLEVPGADAMIPMINQLQEQFELVIAVTDWHPSNHISFAANHPGYKVGDILEEDDQQQILWVTHGVQNTKGAEFHPRLDQKHIQKIIRKGIETNIDSYSAFYDMDHRRSTGLGDYLAQQRIHEVYVAGVATEFCVKYSCLDAVRLGFKVYLIEDACRGVTAEGVESAFEEMRENKIKIIKAGEIE